MDELRGKLSRSIRDREMVLLLCNCSVEYSGRAVSTLGWGDRLVLVKPDRTVLVHKPDGRNPVNWMPEGTNIEFLVEGDELLLNCDSVNPRESMVVRVRRVLCLESRKLRDGEELVSVGSEADMARRIYDNPSLISESFKPVSREEQTKYGFIDVLGHEGGVFTVVECKRYKAGLSAVQQLRRYVERLQKMKGVMEVKGVLAAPSITGNAKKMLEDWSYRFVSVEPPMFMDPDKSEQKRLADY